MFKAMISKIKESFLSVIPVMAIVLILSCTPLISLSIAEVITFIACSILLIVGMALFNLGADIAMTPMGEKMGSGLIRHKSLIVLVSVCFAMGLLITIAEPDLSVLASQVGAVISDTLLVVTVSVGVGLFLVIAVLKIIFNKDLSALLMFFYMTLFAIASIVVSNGNGSFLSVGFDSGGVTTGPITVPFIMAIGVGIASAVGGRRQRENSFGLIALCSIGPIVAVMILGMGANGNIPYVDPAYVVNLSPIEIFHVVGDVCVEVAIALGLILAFFLLINFIFLRVPTILLKRIGVGVLYTYVGLVIFLSSVNVGFLPIGYTLGKQLALSDPLVVCVLGFVLGCVVVLAEPAVHVLNRQVEEITGGTVSKKSMMIALSVGVGISICLSMIRIVFSFSILYYVIPGYLLSLGLSFFVPRLYTAIAFDSGGVASGPLTSGFILPLAIGACIAISGGAELVMSNAFGVVAMVAMTPLITIQLLGFRAITARKVKQRIALKRILDADDCQIIDFM